MTPFIAGRAAYKAGKTSADNPHDRNKTFSVDKYPGDWANWKAGYINAKATAEHTKRTTA